MFCKCDLFRTYIKKQKTKRETLILKFKVRGNICIKFQNFDIAFFQITINKCHDTWSYIFHDYLFIS